MVRLERRADGSAVFSVKDSGPGIAGDDVPHVFDAFTQFETGFGVKPKGTGLGLTISQQYAYMVGGDITVRSTPGAGSTFTLTVPDIVSFE